MFEQSARLVGARRCNCCLRPFGLQQAIDGRGTDVQQFLFSSRRESQLAELLELGDQLRHDGHQPFATTVIQQFPKFA